MGILIIANNRKAFHDYHVTETIEAGLVLQGSEVKSLRNRQCQLKDSYVIFKNNEAFLTHVHISEYKSSSYNNHEPERDRKLLLNRRELDRLEAQLREKGLACVPLKIYLKEGKFKVELGVVKGKKKFDRRDDVKTREANREMERRLRQ